jgi:hypothetical protein
VVEDANKTAFEERPHVLDVVHMRRPDDVLLPKVVHGEEGSGVAERSAVV